MPSSTPWRNGRGADFDRLPSPSRPSNEHIERLSPVPFFSSHDTDGNPAILDAREQPLFGLGLSGSIGSHQNFAVSQPDHLYIDSDGGAHIGAKVRTTSKYSHGMDTRARDGIRVEARSSKTGVKSRKARLHTRSGSTIDDLANIAIATSPTFDNSSPTFSSNSNSLGPKGTRPSTSQHDSRNAGDIYFDRPFKRVRSEKLPSTEWTQKDERPRTSHDIQPQSTMEDAELLLGLRNGYSFSTNTSPVFLPATTVQVRAPAELIQVPVTETNQKTEQPSHYNESAESVTEPKGDEGNTEKVIQVLQVEAPNPDDQMIIDEPSTQLQDLKSNDLSIAIAPQQNGSFATKPLDSIDAVAALHSTASAEKCAAALAKKPRKIKPEIQAEVCAACQTLQRESNGEDATTQWICCDYCGSWFHLACGGFKDKAETRAVDKFVCKNCEPAHGQTTFVRKSSRVRTAIDYAGLNQGVVKSSEESSMHHYIQPIKDGTIKILPDDFARVRPELLTAEFWENMDNMKRPFVVPAHWNPRFGVPQDLQAFKDDALEAEPTPDPSFVSYDSHGMVAQIPKKNEDPVQDPVLDNTSEDVVINCDQDFLDMVMPRHLTVRKVAELYGPEQPVPVIDVKSQETKGQWTLNEWAAYYEQKGEKPIRNVISLEVSNSPIGKLIRRPKAVRDIDLEDQVWDNDSRTTSNKRPVQFYCLMSVADSYTDFHIDFGGSSVYYHILKGVKTFFFIPPEDKNLKEYEKWCNSDTQNETWLGDLCNGNVTRVDLHEGDTAFIPAGWIHSVWTPEDSLVIGGNFLTRLDYELQLRVASIEKNTRVPQKFRYPFFQKVMWYALLKYLDEDPVPEEVLKDFHADEDYRFLRANPIWYEFDDLACEAEPGEAEYNFRLYPKSEINGLPHLRDYLYRTACIHADLSVPDINKKQIDAVKASIPKGHGDPMRLIKTFAVWCAWKTGNEVVPKWVHDQGDGLVSEIKEREKAKEETFRVPPERVSARNASKAKAASPAIEVVNPPATPVANPDVNDTSSTKSRSGSRGGSLRVACEACRKRRIKCRHKEGDEAIANSSPPEIRPRTYSNVSVDIPKLASASPSSSTLDHTATSIGMAGDIGGPTDLAQAALATLHSQSSDSNQASATTPGGGSVKKGRSKACEECRKSKRRCVHDEHGRIDPAKAAEPSKPRGTINPKRPARTSDEHPAKRHRTDSEGEQHVLDMANGSDIDMMIDPALMGEGFGLNATIHAPTESIVHHDGLDSDVAPSSLPPLPSLDHEITAAGVQSEDLSSLDAARPVQTAHIEDDLHLPINTEQPVLHKASMIPAYVQRSPEIDISYSPITVDGNLTESTEKAELKAEDGLTGAFRSRQSPYQPKQAQRHLSEERHLFDKKDYKDGGGRRASSSSERTLGISIKSRRSSSNTSGTTHHAVVLPPKQNKAQEASIRPASRASSVGSDMDADEKFARELQAAENGLRRRASMRA